MSVALVCDEGRQYVRAVRSLYWCVGHYVSGGMLCVQMPTHVQISMDCLWI